MLRVAGGILLLLGGLGFGLMPIKELARRAELLAQWERALLLLEGELTFSMPTMPRLLEELSEKLPPPMRETFSAARVGMERLGECTFAQIWEQAVIERSGLEGEELASLCLLGKVLGRYDSEERKSALQNAQTRMHRQEMLYREELRNKGRAYGMLGLSVGAFVVILLL